MDVFFETLEELLDKEDGEAFLKANPFDRFGEIIEKDFLIPNNFRDDQEINLAVDYFDCDSYRAKNYFNLELKNLANFISKGGDSCSKEYSNLINNLESFYNRAIYDYRILCKFKPFFEEEKDFSKNGDLDENDPDDLFFDPFDDVEKCLEDLNYMKKLIRLEREFPGLAREVYYNEQDFNRDVSPLLLREDYLAAAALKEKYHKSLQTKINQVYSKK